MRRDKSFSVVLRDSSLFLGLTMNGASPLADGCGHYVAPARAVRSPLITRRTMQCGVEDVFVLVPMGHPVRVARAL